MSIISADFTLRLSGGASNTDGNASLGGIKSSQVVSSSVDALFDAISAGEAATGGTEYRVVYLHNANATDTMINAVVYISSQTSSPTTSVEIGVGTAAVNGVETALADESTAPVGVTFSAPSTAGAGLALGSIPPGQHKAIHIKWVADTAAAATASDALTLAYRCETV